MINLQQIKNYSQEVKLFKKRIFRAIFLIGVLLVVLVTRLLNLQVFNHEFYSNLSSNNQLAYLPIEPNRGLIYDRNGVLLAENLPTFSLNIIAKNVKNYKESIENLKTIIDITPEDIKQFEKTAKRKQRFEHIPLKMKLTSKEMAAFYTNQYRSPGIIIENKMLRHYPLTSDTVNVVGYVGRISKQDLKNIDANNYSASDFIGKVGIEKYYENSLHGQTGHKVIEVDANGKIIRTLKVIPPIHGDNLYLTIDSKLQQIALKSLEDNQEKGAVVAIDPNNGEVLAMVSNPSYDPNLFATGIDNATFNNLQSSKDKPMYNRATKSLFPLASTIKPFLALQALDTSTISTNDKIYDPGWFKLPNNNHKYRDWKYKGHGIVNITKAIIVSCDTFFYDLSVKLGISKISNILNRFGFGNKTYIDIEEESAGIVATPDWKRKNTGNPWYTGDTIISGIGQGFMSTTPLQLAHGVATISMRGQRFKPHLLLATQKSDKTQKVEPPIPLPAVMLKNSDSWEIVIKAMEQVIKNPEGTAHRRFGKNIPYTVAGKTGGAQLYHHKIVNEVQYKDRSKIPKHLRDHSLFIAFAPIENPEIALAVVVENSSTAPKIAKQILDYYFAKN